MDLVALLKSLRCKPRQATNFLHHFVQTLNYLNGNFNLLYCTVHLYTGACTTFGLCMTLCPKHFSVHEIGRVGALVLVTAVSRIISVDEYSHKIFGVADP